jgi:FAD/FMN-containing dehydrogenase
MDRRARRTIVVLVLLAVLLVGGQRTLLWSAGSATAKDCAIHAVPAPGGELPPRATSPPYPTATVQRGGTVNDASCLNRTRVYGVVRPRSTADVREALAFARAHELTVSVAGTRHAMGGQAMRPGALLLDMTGVDEVRVDTAARTVRVGAGARWHDVLDAVHPRGLSVATMPGIDVLSVGGTVSVNAHGLDFRQGALSSSIRSLRVMTADGAVHTVGPDREPQLFRAVVGGYGLLGVVLDVELELVDSEAYRLRGRAVDVTDLPRVLTQEVVEDSDVRMAYTHLSTSPGSLLREGIVYTYERAPAGEPVPPLETRGSDRLGRLVLNLARTGGPGQRLKWRLQRDLLPHVRSCHVARNQALRDAEACMVSRNQAMYESLGLLRNRLPQYTDVLHEYFLPPDQLVPFLADLRGELDTHDAVLLNASVRMVRREDVALDYAQGERLSVVLYLSQRVTSAGNDDMRDLTQQLVARSLARGGTFYLPYQQHYTTAQVRQAYPGFDAFVATKRTHDPGLLFRNSLWDRYAGSQPADRR